MQDINLYQLLKFYAKKWYWILLITAIGVAAGFAYNNYIQTPLYKSSATLILVSPGEKRTTQDVTLINNYIQLFKSRRVLEPVIRDQNLQIDYDTLVQSIEATNEKNTEVIKVAISTPDAETSKKLVEGSVESFKNEAKELYNLDNIKLVDGASQPDKPFNVFKEFVLIASGFGGFVTALLGLFFVYDYRLTQKPAKKAKAVKKPAKPAKAKAAAAKAKPSVYQKLIGVKPEAKKPTTRKKPAATKPKAKKPATKKTTKQQQKDK